MGNEVGSNDLGHEVSLDLSCNLKWIRQRKHNTKCRDSEVHQHIPALSRIRTKCGKNHFGKHPAHLSACDAESVCTARSQNMSWLALILQSAKCRDANIRTSCDLYWRFPNRFGSSPQWSIHYTMLYTNIRHLNWRAACKPREFTSLQNSSSNNLRAVPRDSMVGCQDSRRRGNRSHLRSEAWHTRRKPLEKFEKRVSTICRRCSWASCLCKRRYHRTSHLTTHCKETNQEGFRQAEAL